MENSNLFLMLCSDKKQEERTYLLNPLLLSRNRGVGKLLL